MTDFLDIAGIAVLVAEGTFKENPREQGGSFSRSYAGSARVTIRWEKRSWQVKTLPMLTSDVNTLINAFAAGKVVGCAGNAFTTISAPAPTQNAPSTSTTGGTGLAASTAYYYKVTAIFNGSSSVAGGSVESPASGEQSITTGLGTTNSNTVNWSAVTGATGYRVYRGTTAGAESVYYQVGAVTSYVDTGAAGSVAATPPAVVTVYCVVTLGDGTEKAAHGGDGLNFERVLVLDLRET